MAEKFQNFERILSVRRSLYNIIWNPAIDPNRERMIKDIFSRMGEIFGSRGFQFTTYSDGGTSSILSADFRTGDLAVQGNINYRDYDFFNGLIDISIRTHPEIKERSADKLWDIASFGEQYAALRRLLKMD